MSVAAILRRRSLFACWSYPICCVVSLCAGPVGCISYNMYNIFVDAELDAGVTV